MAKRRPDADELEAGRLLRELAETVPQDALLRFGDVLKRCGLVASDETPEADSSRDDAER